MRILIITDKFLSEKTTVGKIAYNISKKLLERGDQVFIATTTRARDGVGETEYKGIKVFSIYSDYHERWRSYLSLYNPQTVKKVGKIINKLKPDIVHAHNIHYYLSYYCLKLAKRSGAKVFLTAHDVMAFHYGKLVEFIDPDDLSCPEKFDYKVSSWQQIKESKKRYNPFRNIVIRYYLRYADKIFAVSDALQEALNQNGIGNTTVMYNGINVSDWEVTEEKVEEFRKKYKLANKKIVLFGGRLSGLKGGFQAVAAMDGVIKNMPEAKLLVIGSPSAYTKEIGEFAKSMGISRNLIFTGWIEGEDLKAAYHSADVVVVPSICFDSFPTMILEAMACKKPVVATCFGGAREAVQNGFSGYIINPYNTGLFSERIFELLNNPKKSGEFGKRGHEIVKEKFSLDSQVNNLLQWYGRLYH